MLPETASGNSSPPSFTQVNLMVCVAISSPLLGPERPQASPNRLFTCSRLWREAVSVGFLDAQIEASRGDRPGSHMGRKRQRRVLTAESTSLVSTVDAGRMPSLLPSISPEARPPSPTRSSVPAAGVGLHAVPCCCPGARPPPSPGAGCLSYFEFLTVISTMPGTALGYGDFPGQRLLWNHEARGWGRSEEILGSTVPCGRLSSPG